MLFVVALIVTYRRGCVCTGEFIKAQSDEVELVILMEASQTKSLWSFKASDKRSPGGDKGECCLAAISNLDYKTPAKYFVLGV